MERFVSRLKEKAKDRFTRPVIYVALGDSVTQGFREHSPASDILYHQGVYHAQFQRRVQEEFPATVVSVINAGVGGDTATGSLGRLNRDVLSFNPDLVTISFGLNDAMAKMGGLAQYASSLEAIVERVRSKTQADILFLTPNMMLTADNPNVHPQHRKFVEPMLKVSQGGILTAYVERMRQLGERLQVSVVDVFAIWEKWEREGRDIDKLLANGLNHPGEEGHRLVAELLWEKICSK